MRASVAIAISAAAVLTAAGGGLLLAPEISPPEHSIAGARLVAAARAVARPGDIVFKSGGGFWGRLAASFSEHDRTFGHVGIIILSDGGEMAVIHAGGDPASMTGRVMVDGLDHFLGASKAAALYRPQLDGASVDALVAFALAARGAPFDADFSLESEDELYCTELVWRALLAVGAGDPVPEKSVRAGRRYIALDALQESPLLARVWTSPPVAN